MPAATSTTSTPTSAPRSTAGSRARRPAAPRPRGRHVLLLDVGRPDGERRARLPGRDADRLPALRPGPGRPHLALPPLGRPLLAPHAPAPPARDRPRPLPRGEGGAPRRLAA